MLFFYSLAEETEITFSYEVNWQESGIKWASRWDTYLNMTDVQIHWFSIINSLVVVFFLAGMLRLPSALERGPEWDQFSW